MGKLSDSFAKFKARVGASRSKLPPADSSTPPMPESGLSGRDNEHEDTIPVPVPEAAASSVASSVVSIINGDLYASRMTTGIFQSLEAMFAKSESFWSKTAGKNIALTDKQKKLRSYILQRLREGALGQDAALREKPVQEILKKFQEDWRTVNPEPNPIISTAGSGITTVGKFAYNYTIGLLWRTPASSSQAASIPPSMTQEEIDEDLEGLFNPVIVSIQHDYLDNIEGMLKRWSSQSTQAPEGLPFSFDGNERADRSIDIRTSSGLIERAYATALDSYKKEAFKNEQLPALVGAVYMQLKAYYAELLKLNRDLNASKLYPWKQESVQNALDFYFDQHVYLYKILSITHNESSRTREAKLDLMLDYKRKIKALFAREEVYTSTFGPFAFGFDKWTKIEAAMEQYVALCDFSGVEIPRSRAENQQRLRFAGEQGDLRTLKARGLHFRYGEMKDNDPFAPLPYITPMAPIRPR